MLKEIKPLTTVTKEDVKETLKQHGISAHVLEPFGPHWFIWSQAWTCTQVSHSPDKRPKCWIISLSEKHNICIRNIYIL